MVFEAAMQAYREREGLWKVGEVRRVHAGSFQVRHILTYFSVHEPRHDGPLSGQSLWVHDLIRCRLLEAMCDITLLCGDHMAPATWGKYDQSLVAGAGAGTWGSSP